MKKDKKMASMSIEPKTFASLAQRSNNVAIKPLHNKHK